MGQQITYTSFSLKIFKMEKKYGIYYLKCPSLDRIYFGTTKHTVDIIYHFRNKHKIGNTKTWILQR